ncbi:phosphatidylinositol N-acetylglucosaminyltransferase subunit H [Gastrophryne carolinensis]
MEQEKEFSDIHGNRITLQQRLYSDTCREFTVTGAKLSVRSVAGWTCAVWLAAYGAFLYTEHTAVLSGAILCNLLGLILYLHLGKVERESLLLLGSLGAQRSRSFASGRESTVFIELCRLHDVIINEVISMQRVHYHLCLLLRDPRDPQAPNQVVPVFQSCQPRLDCLQEIYRSCQDVLAQRNQAMPF